MRKIGSLGGRKTITATPRQLEALIRMSEALAKMRLAKYVEVSDVKEAIRLIRVAIQQVFFFLFLFSFFSCFFSPFLFGYSYLLNNKRHSDILFFILFHHH